MPFVHRFLEALGQAGGAWGVEQLPAAEAGAANARLLRLDLPFNPRALGGKVLLAVEVMREAYPRDVRNAIGHLEARRDSAQDGVPVIPVLLAERLSAGARAYLRERNIAHFDGSGSLYLSYGTWLINIERASEPAPPRRVGSLFMGAREQVVHALLTAGEGWLSGLELATLSETSTYTVSMTLQELERLEWVQSQGKGRNLRRRLAKPGELLDAWAEAWRQRKEAKSRWYAYGPSLNGLLQTLTDRLGEAGLADWGVTGTVAANITAPLLTSVDTIEFIVPPGHADQYAEAMGLKKVDRGSNVTLVERAGASRLFRHQPQDTPASFASPFIQYLDLQDDRGRNLELAAHLRAAVLKV